MTTSRDASIDVAKGLAITLIVFGHIWRGLFSADILSDADLYHRVDNAVYMSHLSVFAFVSGLFIAAGMKRDGSWNYTRKRAVNYLWLYLVWFILQNVFKLLAGGLVNQPLSLIDAVAIWQPQGQLWFFGWICSMLVLAAIARPWLSTLRAGLSLVVSLALSLATWGYMGFYLFAQGYALTVFFFAGLVLTSGRLLKISGRLSPMAFLAIAVAGGLVFGFICGTEAIPPTIGITDRDAGSVALGVVGSLSGTVCILALSGPLSKARFGAAIAYLGRNSLTIFLGHILFAASTRILLGKLGVSNLGVQVVAGLAIGIAGPLVLAKLAPSLRLGWLFENPSWLKRLGKSA